MVQFNRLRLTGFKSFVEHTELEIGKGLTGIIGPNGCGKSNIVEAIRWAMGENSPKRMRSGDMDDVIFAGTERRPARNTAEVTLLLDNSDRTAPAELNDSDELEISRKIERDVGSTYKVNGKNVRMRDVQLLFADSSVGAHSPALVSQGRVSDMINAKPTQRRMVLEEAAGISGLHARRHEAELKLRAAETNLTRVEDVLGSMNVQLESLKKQARQASRYRNLSGHIQTAEGGLLYLRWTESATAVAAALAAFEEAENIVREKTLSVTELTTKQTEAAAQLPDLRQSEAESAAGLQRLKLAYGSLEGEERQVEEERAKSEQMIGQYNADVAHETAQKTEAGQTIERLAIENAELTAAALQQADAEEEARLLAEEQQRAVEKIEFALTELTEETAAQEAERAAAERRIADLARRHEQLEQRKTRFEAEHAELIANTPAKTELDEITAGLTFAEEETQKAAGEIENTESARGIVETALQEATERFQEAQKTAGQLNAEAEALRRVLRTEQTDFEPVLDKLTVESGLERALAVALGDDLQAALDGSAPIYWRDLPDFASATALPAAAKPLSQCVTGPHALGRTLSQIGIVENAAIAEQLMAELQPGQCLVTADGGAWRWDGLVVSPNADNAAAIRLQQKNRLAELETEIAAAEEQLQTARFAHDGVREERARVTERVNAARQAAREAGDRLNTLRRRHAQLTNQLSEVTARLAGLTTSIENAAQEIDVLATQIAEAREAFAALPDTAESREKIAAMKTDLGAQRQTLVERQTTHAEIRRAGENRARRMEQVNRDMADWNARVERIAGRLAELQARIRAAEETLGQLAERPAQIAQEKQALMTHITAAEEKRRAAADALVSAENIANEAQRELRIADSALSDAREARAMAQAGVNTSQHTQSGFEAQIQEKFACAPEQMVTKLELAVAELPAIHELHDKLERLIRERDNMGPVNLRAEVESQEITDQMTGMQTERDDLVAAIDKLREGINKLNKEARDRLLNAFDTVNTHFQSLFTRLFNGGSAYLKLIEADDPLQSGLEIFAQPPGKKPAVLSLLSGGEQTLTSIALIFAMFLTNPAPICVLDEVDAPLDESNVDRYCMLLEKLSEECDTRFLVITHHRMTMARMDRLYGVTMSEKGVSQLVSVDLKQHALDLEDQAA
ncbi:MAG: chromosome segregation protein SMC [Alphaproteobacteria bacterium]|nr:chromosome segregation protein SMC [Alphaproteobacteria bacterium]